MRKLIPVLIVVGALACKREMKAPYAATETFAAGDSAVAQRASVQVASAPPPPFKSNDAQRMIIRNASISMTVEDTAAAIDKITAAGESVGGYVSDSRIWRDGEQLRGSISLRIPADRLTAALGVIRKIGSKINSETISSQEVTQEYVDLESQVRNLEATEAELRQLMSTIRQNSKKASEVLEMYQQLNSVRMQIEQMKGRMRYLSQMSAFAIVGVEVIPNALTKPVVEPGGWQALVIVKDASRSLVAALQSLAGIAIWIGIYILPMAVLLGIAILSAWKLLARFARREESAV
jgi:hypothetical protein